MISFGNCFLVMTIAPLRGPAVHRVSAGMEAWSISRWYRCCRAPARHHT
jgi:hypothetical protein